MTDKTNRLNSAFNLQAQGYTLDEALTQHFELSRRQAYRYVQDTQERCARLGGFALCPDHHQNTEDVVTRLRALRKPVAWILARL
jgi:hypothetical protein